MTVGICGGVGTGGSLLVVDCPAIGCSLLIPIKGDTAIRDVGGGEVRRRIAGFLAFWQCGEGGGHRPVADTSRANCLNAHQIDGVCRKSAEGVSGCIHQDAGTPVAAHAHVLQVPLRLVTTRCPVGDSTGWGNIGKCDICGSIALRG